MTDWTPIPTTVLDTALGPLLAHWNGTADEYPDVAALDPDKARRERRSGTDDRPCPKCGRPPLHRVMVRTRTPDTGRPSADELVAVPLVTINRVPYAVGAGAAYCAALHPWIVSPWYALTRDDWSRHGNYDTAHGTESARTVAVEAILAALDADHTADLAAGINASLRRRARHLEEAHDRLALQLAQVDAAIAATLDEIASPA